MAHQMALTPREREVVRHLAIGLTATEAGRVLKISGGTVRNHRQNIYRKLRVNRAAMLARWALEHGLIGRRRNGKRRTA